MDGGGNQASSGVDRLKNVSQIEARSRVTVAARRRGVDGMKLQKQSATVVIVVRVKGVGVELIRGIFMGRCGGGTVPAIGEVPHSTEVASNGPIAGRGRNVAG